jgi:hypothetical protein
MDWRSYLALPVLSAALIALMGASAGATCTCRANGKVFEQGDLACIRTNGGPKLARCGMELNVSSWKVVSDGCPEVSLPASATTLASLAVDAGNAPRLCLPVKTG